MSARAKISSEWKPSADQSLPVTPQPPVSPEPSPQATPGHASRMLGWLHLSRYTTLIAVVLDYFSISAGSFIGFLVYTLIRGTQVANEDLKLFGFASEYTIAFFLFGRVNFIYRYDHSLLSVRNSAGILRVSSFSLLVLTVESFFSKLIIPRLLVVLCWIFITLFVLLQKHATRSIIARLKAHSEPAGRVLIIGSGSEARRIYSFLLNSPNIHLKPIAFFETQTTAQTRIVYSHDYRFRDHAPVYSGALDIDLLKHLDITDIFVAEPTISPQKIAEVAALGAEHGAKLSFLAATQPSISTGPINFQVMDGLVVSSFASRQDASLGHRIVKRFTDLTVSVAMILVSLPLWIGCALWIRLSSEGPIFFKQERIGIGGKRFKIFKFRSMYATAPSYGRSPESHTDSRITSAGRFLRKTSLDELPQLINVLRGEMSLVGPRPEMPYIVAQYSPHQRRRLSVPQGLTGVWQLSADRRFAIHESIEYDMYYIENRGIFLDLAILLHTAAFAMKGI